MAGNNYFDQFVPTYTSEPVPQALPQPGVGLNAASSIASINADPMSALTMNTAMERGNTLATNNQIISDYQAMPFMAFEAKYGPDAAAQMSQLGAASQELVRYQDTPRDLVPRAGDFASGAVKGLVGGLGDAATLLAGAANQDAGIWASNTTQGFRDWMDENTQTDANNRNRVLGAIRSELDGQDNEAQYERDKETDSGFMAGLKYLGRGFVNGAYRFYEDPQSLETGLSEGVGSLLAGGPIAKGLGLAGKLAGVGKLATAAAMPTAIGMMEGGSAYSGTIQEVMGMSHEDLMLNSPTYRQQVTDGVTPDQAKENVAARAAEIAAAVQTPIGALTGKLVAGFEANPLGAKGFREMIRNIVSETVEEGAQSASGQFAQNLGVQQSANENQNLLEDVGDQTAQGAILGSLTAGVLQAPKVPAVAISEAVTSLKERGAVIRAANEAASGVTEADTLAAAETLSSTLEPIAEAAQKAAENVAPDAKTEIGVDTLKTRIQNAVNISPADIQQVGGATVAGMEALGLERPTTKQALMVNLARVALTEELPMEARQGAAFYLLDQVDKADKLFKEDLDEVLSSITDQASPEYTGIKEYQTLIEQLKGQKKIMDTVNWIKSNSTINIDENTPANEQTVVNAVRATTAMPTALGAQGARTILKQADDGDITVTPEQRKALRNTQVALEIMENVQKEIEAAQQSEDILTDTVKDVADQVTKRGMDNDWGLSLDQHIGRVNAALEAGDTQMAGAALRSFGNFAWSQMSKANAWIKSAREGGTQEFSRLGSYGRLNPVKGKATFYANSPASLATARQIVREANMLIEQFNAMADANPEIGITRRLDLVERAPEFFGTAGLDQTNQQTQDQPEATQQAEPREETAQPTQKGPFKGSLLQKIVYHASNDPDFSKKKIQIIRDNTNLNNGIWLRGDLGKKSFSHKIGFYVTNDPIYGAAVAGASIPFGVTDIKSVNSEDMNGVKVHEFYVNITKPYYVKENDDIAPTSLSSEQLQSLLDQGYDAVVDGDIETAQDIVIFSPDQLREVEAKQAAPSEKTSVEETVDIEVNTAPEVAKSSIEKLFPFLFKASSAIATFHRAFSGDKVGKYLEYGEPINDLIEALNDKSYAVKFGYEPEQMEALQDYLREGLNLIDGKDGIFDPDRGLAGSMADRVRQFARTKYDKNGPDTDTIWSRIKKGLDVSQWVRGHAFSVIENVDGSYRYNPALTQTAVLAALHWFSSSQNRQSNLDKETLAKNLGVDVADLSNAKVLELNGGVGLTEATRGLAQTIREFWGLTPNRDADTSLVNGIPEAVAKEIIASMESMGWMTSGNVSIPGKDVPFRQYYFGDNISDNVRRLLREMGPAKKLIATIGNLSVETNATQFDTKIDDVAPTQMRNRAVRNTKTQRGVIRKAQAIPHYFYENSYDMQRAISAEGWIEMMGSRIIGEDTSGFNEEHLKSLRGKNLTITMAFDAMEQQKMELEAHARVTKQNDITGIKKFYPFNFSRVNRLQMLGVNNPQSDKIARHVWLPTKATIDLTDPNSADSTGFWMAMAQGLGVKTQHFDRAENARQGRELVTTGKFAPLVQELADWLKNGKQGSLRAWSQKVRQADSGITEHGIMSLLSAAEYVVARDTGNGAGLTEFTTHNYFEADGVTNGAANALMNLTVDPNEDWVNTVAKTGAFIGRDDLAMDSQAKSDDLYKTAAVNLAERQKLFADGLPEQVKEVHDALFRLMRGLGMKIEINDKGEISIERKVLKNPLTITIYGSGVDGIAGNVAGEMMDNFYQALTDHLQSGKKTPFGEDMVIKGEPYSAQKFWSDLDFVLNNVVNKDENGEWTVVTPKFAKSTPGVPSNKALSKVAINPNDFRTLRDNVRALMVDNMVAAIEDTVMGHVGPMVDTIQKATNAQSIVMHYMFRKEVLKAVAAKKATSSEKNVFLSQEELDAILTRLMPYGAVINTEHQSFFLGSSEQTPVMSRTNEKGNKVFTFDIVDNGKKISVTVPESYSRALFNDMKTTAFMYAPGIAGVSGVPSFNIGTGDGRMIDIFLQNLKGFGVLPVFDGINLPVNRIVEGSQLANGAVMQSWTENPAKAVADSFRAWLSNNPLEQMFDPTDAWNVEMDAFAYEMTKNAMGVRKPRKVMGSGDLQQKMELFLNELETGAQQIADRIAAIKQLPMSVDQMAGGHSPATQKGAVKLPVNPTAMQVATAIQHQMKVVAAARTKGEAISGPNRDFVAAFRSKAGTDPDTGALVADVASLNAIRKTLNNKLSNVHKEMLNAAIQSLGDSGLTVVFGTPEMVDRYEQNNYPHTYQAETSSFEGKIDVENNVIYLTNPSAETLAHELLHAATITKMQGFYADKKSVSVTDAEAITRMEGLMNEWLAKSYEREGPAVGAAHRMAISSIMGHLNAGRKAEGLNEFLAWSLSNQNIINLQKKMQVQNPLYVIMGKALTALKQLIWGHKKAPEIGTDMFSQVRFNARVLMASPTPVALFMRDFGSVAMYQSETFGTDPRLSEMRRRFGEHINTFVGTERTDFTAKEKGEFELRQRAAQNALMENDLIARAMAAPFGLDMQQKSTFEMIGATLAIAQHLNKASLARMNDVYMAVIDKLNVDDFLYNDGRDAEADRYQAQEKYNALIDGGQKQLANFIALANVSPQMREILRGMEFPARIMDKSWKADALFDRASAAVASGMANYASGQGRKNIDLLAAMDALTDTLISNVGDQRSFIEQRVDNGLDNADNLLKTFIEKGAKKSEAWLNTLSNPIGRKVAKFLTILARSFTVEGTKSLQRTAVSFHNQPEVKHAHREAINEVIGRTEENAPVFDMITRVKTLVDQTRQHWRDEFPSELRKAFKRDLSKQEWADLHMGLGRTDAGALLGTYRRERTLELLSLGSERRAEISALESRLPAQVLPKAKQLARYMTTGKPGKRLQRNAYSIASHNGAKEMRAEIDNLVSLYALEMMPESAKNTLENLIENDVDGLAKVFHATVSARNDELAKMTTDVAQMNHFKGHIRGLSQEGVHLTIQPRSDHEHYLSMGYTPVGDYMGSTADVGTEKKAYYYAPVSGRPKFNQGVMQTVQQSVFGVNPDTGHTVGMLNAGRITDPRAVAAITKRLDNELPTDENLMPIYDGTNRVIAYERAADPAKLTYLKEDFDLAKTLSAWKGRQSEEQAARMVNEELVDKVYDMWTFGRQENRTNEFVDMSKSTDPIIADAWSVIPRETKEYIKAKFGQDGFRVRRDVLLDVAGARSASVGDFWTGNSRWSPVVQQEIKDFIVGLGGNDAYRYLVNAEKLFQQVVTDAKVLIVVKSVIVPAANFVSNIYQLSMNGVPIRHIFTGFKRKTYELNTYIQNRERERQLQTELFVAEGANDSVSIRKLSARIQAIKDSYKQLSIWPLLENGEFGAITEGGISQEDLALSKGGYAALIDKIANKIPDNGMRDAARYAFVTRDTSLFKALSRATQYGDFLAKAVLYDDLMNRKGMSQTEALAFIQEEFVNYNRFAGRNRAYLESMGMTWFYNFKLRLMKIGQRALQNHPVRALLHTALTPRLPLLGSIGNPITDNMLAVIMDGRLGYSTGPGMLFRAPQLNPWMAIIN